MADLREMLEKRQGSPEMYERDFAYQVTDSYIMSRTAKRGVKAAPQLTYKPFSTARFQFAAPKDHKLAINLSRSVHSYFTSTFSKLPRLDKVARDLDPEAQKDADRMSFWLDGVFNFSRVKAAQPRAASWLSNRGDSVFGVEWDTSTPAIYVRTYDPEWCYPTLDPYDVGGVTDMLIHFVVPRKWAEETYGVVLRQSSSDVAHVYTYWDAHERLVQVESKTADKWSFKHDLKRCPFRWVFGNADGMFAQSDIRDIPSLQDFYNENLLLAMDTIRKQVDASWIVFGHNREIAPIPGKAVSIPRENAKMERFEAGGNPEVIMSVMEMLRGAIESQTGISPASSRGQVSGSTLTGAAVRNQVQAVEARNEARKSAFEDVYEQVGELCLQVLERCMPKDKPVRVMQRADDNSKNGYVELQPSDVDGHYLWSAAYSGFIGMALEQRIQAAMMGLGRGYGLRTAVKLMDIPDTNPESMKKEIAEYQTDLAITAAKAQALGQKVAQGAEPTPAQGGAPQADPNAAPQRPQPAPPPGPQQMGVVTLGDIERALQAVKSDLRGGVWVVGEIAQVGLSSNPLMLAANEHDVAVLTPLMQSLRTYVMAGHPGDQPAARVA